MMEKSQKKRLARQRRHMRVRKKISGTMERPRLNVYRSLSHIYCQVIDDIAGHTLVAASTNDKQIRPMVEGKEKTEQARIVGEVLGRRALEKGITSVVFDRGGWLYHGRIKAMAEGARKVGLKF
ncbi:MAG: 50S ribosomal protein L18 [Anaerolineales bacterium]|nr:50S ribosomal protein L18 [Anaerolineales bacterium]